MRPSVPRVRRAHPALSACILLGLLGLAAEFAVSAPSTIQVTDDRGREIQLEQPAQRIAALMPHAVEMLGHLNAESSVIGILAYPDPPAPLANKPILGDYYSINVEAVLRTSPDLIIAWPSANIASQLEQLETMGIPFYYSEPQTMDGIAATYRDLGALSGHATQAGARVTRWQQGLAELQEKYQNREPVRTFYQIWHEPLFTVSNQNFIGELIRLCGGRNIFATEGPIAPQVARESVLRRDPQVIIATQNQSALEPWVEFPEMTAVRTEQLYRIDDTTLARPTTELLTGARQLCEIIDQSRKSLYTGE